MKFLRSFLPVLFILGLFFPVQAAGMEWKIDKDHSGFFFGVNHIYVPVKGYFSDFDGTVTFSPDNIANASFSFDIPVKSISTGNAKRDKHLLSDDFFSEKEFPTISFRSSSVSQGEDNNLLVKGTLTMRDKSHEVVLPLKFHGSKAHPAMKGTNVAGFSGQLKLNRLEYQVGSGKFAEMGLVDKEVDIHVELEVLAK